ncbi:MAG: TolC family protein [Bacteroidales bacterium]|nr:TolC family protein [Bacteroidales bacterium]
MKTKIKKLFGLLLLAPFLGFSQVAEPMTIEQAIQLALENNYSIKIAKNTTEQVYASWGNAGASPSIALNGNFSKNEPTDATARASIDLGWTVFDGLGMFAAHNRFKSFEEINSISFRSTVENTIRQVMNQYYLIVSTEHQLKSIKQTLDVSHARYEYVLARYEIGSASKLDVLNAKVDYNTDSSSYLRSLELILSAKTSLNQLLARPVDVDFQVVEDIPYAQYLDYAEIRAKALEQNTDLNISRLETQMAEFSKKEVNALLMPTVSVNAGYDLYNHNMLDRGFYYGAGVRMNLFNGLETQRRRRNAKLVYESAQYAEDASLLNLETQLRLNFINYQTNRDLVNLESENIEVAKQNMDISLERYQLGSLSALELRESQRNYLNAINRYTNSLYLTKLSETILLQLAGELVK